MEQPCKKSTGERNIWVYMWNSSQYNGEETKSKNYVVKAMAKER